MTEQNRPNQYATDQMSLEEDTDIEFLRGSGPGGQHRNKTETGVRLYHRPSGITVRADERRSQTQNREIAFARLRKILEELNQPREPRIPTKVPRASKRARLREKRLRSARKQQRHQPPFQE